MDEDLRSWVSGLDGVFARVAARFGRVEPRRQARAYVMGLLAPVERKNGWQLAEAAGDARPDRMQRLLNGARWDPSLVRDDLRDYVVEQLGDAGGVLVVDETGFVKKGTRSAGVQPQPSGTVGRVENCQLGVFLAYVTPLGRALIDAALYLPESWTADRARCERAGIPRDVGFATKPALAQAMVSRALEGSVKVPWVTAGAAYGQDREFRRYLERRHLGYVVAVPGDQPLAAGVGGSAGGLRADEVTAGAPEQAWKRLPAGDGVTGHRRYEWAMATFPTDPDDDLGPDDACARWLLARRPVPASDQATEAGPGRACHLCHGPVGTTIEELVKVAETRRATEECLRRAKDEVGLDQYQVRRYDAWHRHITLAMLAAAYLGVIATHAARSSPPSPMPKRTVSWHI